MEDVRYSELLFLRAVANGKLSYFHASNPDHQKEFGLRGDLYVEMALAALEDLSIQISHADASSHLVARARGEINGSCPPNISYTDWMNPRGALLSLLGGQGGKSLRITFRGLQRIEDLRDLLRRDRILEPFGVLLDLRYFQRDLRDAVGRSPELATSVIYSDMDHFGPINKKFGQAAGDVVMKRYLEVVRDCIAQFGSAYRGRGDEVAALVVGQEHKFAVEIASRIKNAIAAMECSYNGNVLPKVTASIGVASSPPEQRSMEIEMIAEERKRKAKEKGRNRVVSK
jgi:diguanylate cyclase (GGDEF)-like protein